MATKSVNLSKKPNPKKPKDPALATFMREDFDKMIKFSDWRKGEELKALISHYIK